MFAPQNVVLLCVLTCLLQHAHGSEIINGKKVAGQSMPFMASVRTDNGQHICGGFLIGNNVVVTAAHCADRSKPTHVVLGTNNLKMSNKMSKRYNVTGCKFPGYKAAKLGDDIMLLKLFKKVKPNKRIKPIQLAKKGLIVNDDTKCRVAGWGAKETGGGTVDQLEVADVPVVNLKKCQAMWRQRRLELPPNVTCAGGYQTDKGFCKGDSGGPLVCGKVAVGVVSFNLNGNCDYPNVPNVYTDVSKYLPWIKRVRQQKGC